MAKKTYKTGSGKTSYPSDVTDEEWAFCAPYLTLMKEDAPQREHALRTVFKAVRYLVRVGCPWHLIPNDFPPSSSVYQQVQRWIAAGCFEALAQGPAQTPADACRASGAAFGGDPRRTHLAKHAGKWRTSWLRWIQT